MTLSRFLAVLPVWMMPTRVLDAVSVGVLAGEALGGLGDATVVALFERSFYLDVGAALITVGDESLHDGPLNVRVAARADGSPITELLIEPGQRWAMLSKRLTRYDGLEIDLRHATIWQPERPGGAPDRLELKHGLGHLLALLQARDLENDGLIRLVLDGDHPRTATQRVAKPHIESLKVDLPHWLWNDVPTDPGPAIQLLGLGPGLTPSGDDLLAGILIAWHQIGAQRAPRRLSESLLEASAARTTPISLAHLIAAAKGYGASPLHKLLNAVIANRRAEVAEALDAAAKIGHSSGMDAIAGMVLALTAWLQADNKVIINA